MRTLIAAGAAAVVAAGAVDAQERVVVPGPGARPGAGYAVPGARPMPAHPPVLAPAPAPAPAPVPPRRPASWGSNVDGRWWGGANAPGGWAAYRRPARGYVLPRYWNAGRFRVADWRGYGLSAPPTGYNWTRYYDDAVLVDGRGSVRDAAYGLDWDGAGYGAGYAGGYGYDDRRFDAVTYGGDRGRDRRDDGLGGAAIGAVAGGVAGNLIAGRGNRLGGTLIGAGLGAAAGYAVDRNEDRGRRGPPQRPPGRGPAGYGQPGYGASLPVAGGPDAYGDGFDDGYESGYDDGLREDGYGPRGGPGDSHAHPAPGGGRWVSPDGLTTVTTTSGAISGGYAAAGYLPYGAGPTTVTVHTQPVVTTTTTEWVEDRVTYTRAPRRAAAPRAYRAPTKVLRRY